MIVDLAPFRSDPLVQLRDFSNFYRDEFEAGLRLIRWDVVYDMESVNDKVTFLNYNLIR